MNITSAVCQEKTQDIYLNLTLILKIFLVCGLGVCVHDYQLRIFLSQNIKLI